MVNQIFHFVWGGQIIIGGGIGGVSYIADCYVNDKPINSGELGFSVVMGMASGAIGGPGQANYAASKGGMIAMTKSIAAEVASRGITANAIAPGFIKTPMTDVLPEELKKNYLAQIPAGRFGEPEDIANACVFLASLMLLSMICHTRPGKSSTRCSDK